MSRPRSAGGRVADRRSTSAGSRDVGRAGRDALLRAARRRSSSRASLRARRRRARSAGRRRRPGRSRSAIARPEALAGAGDEARPARELSGGSAPRGRPIARSAMRGSPPRVAARNGRVEHHAAVASRATTSSARERAELRPVGRDDGDVGARERVRRSQQSADAGARSRRAGGRRGRVPAPRPRLGSQRAQLDRRRASQRARCPACRSGPGRRRRLARRPSSAASCSRSPARATSLLAQTPSSSGVGDRCVARQRRRGNARRGPACRRRTAAPGER